MVRDVSVAGWYAVVAGAVFAVSLVVLFRFAWPAASRARFAAAAGVALAWPLVLPMLSFGSVVIARLLQQRPPARRRREAARVAA